MESPHIFGKNLNEEKKKDVAAFIQEEREMAREEMDGEYQKTPRDLEFIERINQAFSDIYKDLGLEWKEGIHSSQIHLLTDQAFMSRFADKETIAFADSIDQVCYIDTDRYEDEQELQQTIIHECIHLLTHAKFLSGDKEEIGVLRSGYVANNVAKGHEHFRGFNEGVIERMANQIYARIEMDKGSELPKPEWHHYSEYIVLLNKIVGKMTTRTGDSEHDVWSEFERGLFTGNMMHLRKIEKVFGPGALRILSSIESDHDFDEDLFQKRMSLYMAWFESNNVVEKERIAEQLLSEQEFKAYMRQLD